MNITVCPTNSCVHLQLHITLGLNGCCWLWSPCSSPCHPVGRIVVFQRRSESQQLGDQFTVRTGWQSHTMPHKLLRHKPKVLPALKKQSHISLLRFESNNTLVQWKHLNVLKLISASGDHSIIMPSFSQQSNYVKWGGTIFYTSTTFFLFHLIPLLCMQPKWMPPIFRA